MKSFLQYEWPGNVRELENCIARAIALGDHRTIDVSDLPPAIGKADEVVSGGDSSALSTTALADLERMTILRVFEQAGGDKLLAGRMLGHQPRNALSQAEAVSDSIAFHFETTRRNPNLNK